MTSNATVDSRRCRLQDCVRRQFDKDLTYSAYPAQFSRYSPEDIDLPPNVPPQMADLARQEFADYYGNVTGLDYEVGRIMAFLKDNGLEENTILCYSSDHGDHLRAPISRIPCSVKMATSRIRSTCRSWGPAGPTAANGSGSGAACELHDGPTHEASP